MLTIRALGLVVGRGAVAVAGPLDFELAAGEALLVTGPNGTGKSTLLRTLAGLLAPISGDVAVEGVAAADGEPARRLADVSHYVGHRNALKPTVSVGENLDFLRRYYGDGRRSSGRSVPDNRRALESVGLPDLSDLPCGYLSAGQQRRVCLARLLVVERPVWILDEPTAALDTASQTDFGTIAAAHLSQGGVIVAATHQPLAGMGKARDLQLASPTREGGDTIVGPGLRDDELASAEGWL